MLTSEKQTLKRNTIRYAEYYDMVEIFDNLYLESQKGQIFTNLMEIISSADNIKLAYRNIKRNSGSITPGIDKVTIKDIESIPTEKFVQIIQKKLAWYKPRPVKRKEIPKDNGKTRPLGIPTMIDRIVQQCVLQVLEPICEAKFHERSNGFRPLRSTEHAIAQCCRMIQRQHLYYVVDIDIKGFFDNVNHSRLKKQIWTLGIQDKKLLCIISEMLKAPIILQNGEKEYPTKGTPQGGILSPLLSNIVLNELDWWISSQWETIPTRNAYKPRFMKNGSVNRATENEALRKTALKEMYIVRYADDFKIFCRKRSDAENIFIATKQWLEDRLKLQISDEKSKVINLKNSYSEFLGFKLKASPKGGKYAVNSHISDKARKKIVKQLKEQIKHIQRPKNPKDEHLAVNIYNIKIIGIHNYYQYATNVSLDFASIQRQVDIMTKIRLTSRVKKSGQIESKYIKERYGKSKRLKFINNTPFIPVGYVKTKNAMHKKRSTIPYTEEGRQEIHKTLKINTFIMSMLMRSIIPNRSVEYMDNRISLYAAQYGKCAITKRVLEFDEIHCHHIIPIKSGGTDRYQNLIILHKHVHTLLHATREETIKEYIQILKLDNTMLTKLNKLRDKLELQPIEIK